MNWCQMAVFLYGGALIHFVADFLTHWKKKKRFFFWLHCFLYTLPFIALFWWLNVGYFWLILIFLSHVLIDSQWERLGHLVKKILREESEKETPFAAVTSGLDQVFHLLVLLIIALCVYRVM